MFPSSATTDRPASFSDLTSTPACAPAPAGRHGHGSSLRTDLPSRRRLSPTELIRLCWKAREEGDRVARERIVLSQQGLIGILAGEASKRERGRVNLDDLRQEANVLLLRAIDRFDSSYEVPFGAFAAHVIRCGLVEYCSAQRQLGGLPVRVPRSVWRHVEEVRAASDQLRARQIAVTPQAISAMTTVSLDRAAQLLDLLAKRRVELGGENTEAAADNAQLPSDRAIAAERMQALMGELRQLPRNQREAVVREALGAPSPDPAVAAAGRRGLARLSSSPRLRQLRG